MRLGVRRRLGRRLWRGRLIALIRRGFGLRELVATGHQQHGKEHLVTPHVGEPTLTLPRSASLIDVQPALFVLARFLM